MLKLFNLTMQTSNRKNSTLYFIDPLIDFVLMNFPFPVLYEKKRKEKHCLFSYIFDITVVSFLFFMNQF